MAQPNGCIGIKGRSIQMGDEPMADWALQNCPDFSILPLKKVCVCLPDDAAAGIIYLARNN